MTFRGRGMQTVMSSLVLFKSGVNKTSVGKHWKITGERGVPMMKWNATVIFTSVCAEGGEVRLEGLLLRCTMYDARKTHKNMQMYSAADWQPSDGAVHCKTFPPSVFFSLWLSRLFFYLSASPPDFLSNPFWGAGLRVLAGQGVENRSNHLFIDWNIRGVRCSKGVGATKSGKDRLAGGYRMGKNKKKLKKMVKGTSEMENRVMQGNFEWRNDWMFWILKPDVVRCWWNKYGLEKDTQTEGFSTFHRNNDRHGNQQNLSHNQWSVSDAATLAFQSVSC